MINRKDKNMLYPKINIKNKKNNKFSKRIMYKIKRVMFTSVSFVQCMQYFLVFIEKNFHF